MWLAREVRTLAGVIPRGERVRHMAMQHRIDYALFNPSITVATEKRLIVCSRSFLGIKHDITLIPYHAIVSFRIANGLFLSSLHLRLHGSANKKDSILGTEKEEGEIKGLRQADAIMLARTISMAIDRLGSGAAEGAGIAVREEKAADFVSDGEAGSSAEVEYALSDSEAAEQLPPHISPEDLKIFNGRRSD